MESRATVRSPTVTSRCEEDKVARLEPVRSVGGAVARTARPRRTAVTRRTSSASAVTCRRGVWTVKRARASAYDQWGSVERRPVPHPAKRSATALVVRRREEGCRDRTRNLAVVQDDAHVGGDHEGPH